MEGRQPELNQIYNLQVVSTNITTAGQPSEEELHAVADCGFQVVINLALSNTEYSLEDERGIVESLGMTYEHIPVQWDVPLEKDLEAFFRLMEQNKTKKVFIHCAANKRVSVFFALYRITHLGWPEDKAFQDILQIWEPNPVWGEFFERHKTVVV